MVRKETVIACGFNDPHRRPAFGADQRRRGKLDSLRCADLHLPGHGGSQSHRGRRVDQSDADREGSGHRVGARRNLAHPTLGFHRRIGRQGYGNFRICRRDVLEACGHVKNGIATILARNLNDHAPTLDNLTGFGADCRHHATGIGQQSRVTEPVAGDADLRLRCVDLRLGAGCNLRDPIESRLGDEVLRQQRTVARLVGARLDELPAGPLKGGFRRTQTVFLIFRIESRDFLAGRDRVTDIHRPADHAPVDAKRQIDFGFRLYPAGERHRIATAASGLDGHHPHRPDFRGDCLLGRLAGN